MCIVNALVVSHKRESTHAQLGKLRMRTSAGPSTVCFCVCVIPPTQAILTFQDSNIWINIKPLLGFADYDVEPNVFQDVFQLADRIF